MGSADANDVARCVLAAFDALPSRAKAPLTSALGPDEKRQWVPLAGIVVRDIETNLLQCVAFATGMKCQPRSKLLESQGQILHDSHAEVLAIRAFNRYVLEQCQYLASSPDSTSQLIERTATDAGQAFRIKPSNRLSMYCSEAPCGDCSMELIMAAQQDASPWPSKEYLAKMAANGVNGEPGGYGASEMLGRGHFHQLGIVRRKPARADAPISLSKSCSDKLAMKQCVSLLSSIVSLFVQPDNAYLEMLVLPESQMHAQACQRAFGPQGRLRSLAGTRGVHSFKPFTVAATTHEFAFGRRSENALADGPLSACNASIVHASQTEKIVNGVLSGRRQTDLRAVSTVSRRGMYTLALQVAVSLESSLVEIKDKTYAEMKQHSLLTRRREQKQRVIDTLVGWQANRGDDEWRLQVPTGSA